MKTNTNDEKHLIRMAANRLKSSGANKDVIWANVSNHINKTERRKMILHMFRYAAMILIVLGVGTMVFLEMGKQRPEQPVELSNIALGSKGVELLLSSGERVVFEKMDERISLIDGSKHIDGDNQSMVCSIAEHDNEKGATKLKFNTLHVPRGGEYRLTLADGSKIILNSETTLRFPDKFGDKSREVYLDGEAFFDVEKQANCPFIVHAHGRSIKVLGTRFNVNAHAVDRNFSATLVSGSIQVNNGVNDVTIRPSERYVEEKNSGQIQISTVDVNDYISWLDGKVRFKNESLESIIVKLQRWFDFEVFYMTEDVKHLMFRGVINKYDTFSTVLNNLQMTTDIRFAIKGKTVIVDRAK
ncbi:MAG: FecR family protein [Marinifilaceae bacterium]